MLLGKEGGNQEHLRRAEWTRPFGPVHRERAPCSRGGNAVGGKVILSHLIAHIRLGDGSHV